MILTAHQPQYLPGLRLFDKIARSDMFVYLDTVPMESSGYENRNKIKTAQGWQWLTVPVLRSEYQSKMLCDVRIDETKYWQRKHLNAIQLSYGKATYFDWVMHYIGGIYVTNTKWKWLNRLDGHSIQWIMRMLGINTEFWWSEVGQFEGHKSDLVLDMCKKLGATKYIFGAKGRDYAKVEDFEREGIELEFQDFKHPTYSQLHGEFMPNMSVIDLLMNEGPRSLDIIMGK